MNPRCRALPPLLFILLPVAVATIPARAADAPGTTDLEEFRLKYIEQFERSPLNTTPGDARFLHAVAGVFKLFGIGLLQARLVMALYLLAAVYMFHRLVEHLAGKWVAWLSLALLLSSRSVLFLEYGRQ